MTTTAEAPAYARPKATPRVVVGSLLFTAYLYLSMAILGDAVTGTDWIGAALVILGIGWYTLSERKG